MNELYLKEPTMEEKEKLERMLKEFAEANDEYSFEGLGNFKKYMKNHTKNSTKD